MKNKNQLQRLIGEGAKHDLKGGLNEKSAILGLPNHQN
jgi:hypothetical protein